MDVKDKVIVVTGGADPADALVLSLPDLQPVQTLVVGGWVRVCLCEGGRGGDGCVCGVRWGALDPKAHLQK